MYLTLSSPRIKPLLLFSILTFSFQAAFSFPFQAADTAKSLVQDSAQQELPKLSDHEVLVRGQRLFNGLVYLQNTSMNCASCHSTIVAGAVDSVNWNPDALEISNKYKSLNVSDLANVLLKPSGQKLSLVHKDFRFSEDEISMLKAYMDSLSEKGLKGAKPNISNLLLFILATILFLFSLTDLVITKKVRPKWVNPAVITVTLTFITYILVVSGIGLSRSPGYSPDQPVKFSHAVHAGQNQTDCIYCHSYAPYSKISGIPAINVCMNCHLLVRQGQRSGGYEIAKVVSAYENKQAIEWIQVHFLPDHVYYSHAQHVTAGGISCTVCHGDVKNMDRIVQVSDLSMGWCINCHRTRKVDFSGNKFYTRYTQLAEQMESGERDSVLVDTQGGTQCMRCHY